MIGSKNFLEENKYSSFFSHLFDFIRSNLAVLSVITTLIIISIGWGVYHVSPLNTFEEIAYKQEQNNLKKDFVEFHNNLGNYFLDIEQIDAAKVEFKQILEVDPLNQNARFNLFKCEVFEPISNNSGYDPEISRKRLEMILKQSNNRDPHAYLFLGDIYLSRDQDQALKYYNKSISLNSSVAAAYYGKGLIYDQQDKFNESAEMYEKALNLSPWNQKYLNNLGDAYFNLKEYQKCIDKLTLLYKLNNRYILPYYSLSNSYRLIGDLESARSYQMRQIILLENYNITNLKDNEETWYFTSKIEKEVDFNNYPMKKYYAYYNLGLTYYMLGNENETIKCLKKANELNLSKSIESKVKKVIDKDIDDLKKEQPSLLSKSEEFRKKYLA